jgi:hypothetical protein
VHYAACLVLKCLLSWTGSFICNMFMLLSGVYFLHYLKYRVIGVNVCVVHVFHLYSFYIGYFRYIGDILINHNQNKRDIGETLTEFNKQRTSVKFTVEKEQ